MKRVWDCEKGLLLPPLMGGAGGDLGGGGRKGGEGAPLELPMLLMLALVTGRPSACMLLAKAPGVGVGGRERVWGFRVQGF